VRLLVHMLTGLGMVVGLILRLTAVASVRDVVSFDYQMFFNLLLPPIILSSGYELHQVDSPTMLSPHKY
jgi:hypothetical protein